MFLDVSTVILGMFDFNTQQHLRRVWAMLIYGVVFYITAYSHVMNTVSCYQIFVPFGPYELSERITSFLVRAVVVGVSTVWKN